MHIYIPVWGQVVHIIDGDIPQQLYKIRMKYCFKSTTTSMVTVKIFEITHNRCNVDKINIEEIFLFLKNFEKINYHLCHKCIQLT